LKNIAFRIDGTPVESQQVEAAAVSEELLPGKERLAAVDEALLKVDPARSTTKFSRVKAGMFKRRSRPACTELAWQWLNIEVTNWAVATLCTKFEMFPCQLVDWGPDAIAGSEAAPCGAFAIVVAHHMLQSMGTPARTAAACSPAERQESAALAAVLLASQIDLLQKLLHAAKAEEAALPAGVLGCVHQSVLPTVSWCMAWPIDPASAV
jgi:hypothetical protein